MAWTKLDERETAGHSNPMASFEMVSVGDNNSKPFIGLFQFQAYRCTASDIKECNVNWQFWIGTHWHHAEEGSTTAYSL